MLLVGGCSKGGDNSYAYFSRFRAIGAHIPGAGAIVMDFDRFTSPVAVDSDGG